MWPPSRFFKKIERFAERVVDNLETIKINISIWTL